MNIYINEPLVMRNSRIAKFAMGGGLAVLFAGMILTFRSTEYFYLSLAALLLGFILSQVGIYFTNRWGRHPRPYEVIDRALKGLDGRYSIYHFLAPVAHLMVGPSGVWVLIPQSQGGTISFQNGRYRQRGGSLYLKIFAQENLGRPDLEAAAEINKIQSLLEKGLEAENTPRVRAALVFINPKVEIVQPEEEDAALPAAMVTADKLKDLVRRSTKDKTTKEKSLFLSPGQVEEINNLIFPPEVD